MPLKRPHTCILLDKVHGVLGETCCTAFCRKGLNGRYTTSSPNYSERSAQSWVTPHSGQRSTESGGLMPDTEAIKDTAVSFSLNIEVPDSVGGYVRLLHSDVTIRTIAFPY